MASGSRLYREGLTEILSRQASLAIVATAEDLASAVEAVRANAVDVVLLDMAMPDSRHASRVLVGTGVKVVGLEVEETEDEIIGHAEAGMSAYVTPTASPTDVVAAVEGAIRREVTCSPRITATLLERVAYLAASEPRRPTAKLTAREQEVLDLLEVGLSNKQIARELCIEVATVKNHVHNILGKLNVTRRAEAGNRARALTSR